jgi:enterochelin esterase family protein
MAGCLLGLIVSGASGELRAQEGGAKPLPASAGELARLLAGDNAAAAKRVRETWGAATLRGGKPYPRVEGTWLAWAVEHPGTVAVRRKAGESLGTMVRLDEGGLQALAVDVPNHQVLDYEIHVGEEVLDARQITIDHFPYTEDSEERPGVPKGTLVERDWNDSKIYPGTTRSYVVYVPAAYRAEDPACLMVFQDGVRHVHGPLRAATVFDNLIHRKEMPVTIGVFIDPGRGADQKPGETKASNRGFEYDSLGDAYARFLLEEILPEVEKTWKLRQDPEAWAIAGGSSGASCAWTVAWERPDKFGKVLGWVGSFVDLRGAHVYPSLIRKTERKPIRVCLLAGENDLDNRYGNWPLANLEMEAALKFAGYDHWFEMGPCLHGSSHAAAKLPEMLRWLWRDVK